MNLKIKTTADGVSIDCYITPRASRTEIKGVRNGALSISLQAPPIDGKANKELIKFISKSLRVPKSNIEIIKGHLNRHKSLIIHGVKVENIIHLVNN